MIDIVVFEQKFSQTVPTEAHTGVSAHKNKEPQQRQQTRPSERMASVKPEAKRPKGILAKETAAEKAERTKMMPVSWEHPFGSAFCEVAAIMHWISFENKEKERCGPWAQLPPDQKTLKQGKGSGVILVSI